MGDRTPSPPRTGMRIGSLFSGIGGLELGLERAGVGRVVWQVEIDPFCRSVLAKHWPEVARYEDVKKVGAATLAPVDLICGGFPCQDISSAGKGAGLAGSRSGLWFEFARILGECRPRWVVIENVASGANRWVDAIMAGLEQLDYQALPIPLSARDVGAPHRRERIFVVGHTDSEDDGVSSWVGRRSSAAPISNPRYAKTRKEQLRALGNAVVPQCAEVIGGVVLEIARGCR